MQMAQQAGFENVSVDLMLGTPGQGRQSVEHFVSTFAQLGVQHISGYLLKIEPGTAFAKNQIERALSRRGPERTTVFGYGRTDGAAWIFAV